MPDSAPASPVLARPADRPDPPKALDAPRDLALRQALFDPPRLSAPDKIAALRAAARSRGGRVPIMTMLAPVRGPGKLTIDEALYFGLLGAGIDREGALRFVGKHRQTTFHNCCNDARWFAVVDDKALFYTTVKGAGLPVPNTRAVSGERPRGGYPCRLSGKAETAAFLQQTRDWPLFLKPIDGIFSIGALKLMGAFAGDVELFGGERVSAEDVADYLAALSKVGYLFQDCLAPAHFAAEAFGPMVPSVRFLILYSDTRPEIESAVIKIPSGENVADNYWRRGNMLGALARDTGSISRVVSGFGPHLAEHQSHPVTGASLVGLSIPNWREICETALAAATLFPGVRTQSWDVALTPQGPVLLEFNYGGDLNLHQLAHGSGALTPSFIAHLRRCGYAGKLL
ncbi:MAG TPA: sugar-transfer associated ATP-grasp domain-containing protein [Stellaceae bacterium]|nr:sugar-transfer associated ATP-grasp domain-containing protein [Stellaceae bacterium]